MLHEVASKILSGSQSRAPRQWGLTVLYIPDGRHYLSIGKHPPCTIGCKNATKSPAGLDLRPASSLVPLWEATQAGGCGQDPVPPLLPLLSMCTIPPPRPGLLPPSLARCLRTVKGPCRVGPRPPGAETGKAGGPLLAQAPPAPAAQGGELGPRQGPSPEVTRAFSLQRPLKRQGLSPERGKGEKTASASPHRHPRGERRPACPPSLAPRSEKRVARGMPGTSSARLCVREPEMTPEGRPSGPSTIETGEERERAAGCVRGGEERRGHRLAA